MGKTNLLHSAKQIQNQNYFTKPGVVIERF